MLTDLQEFRAGTIKSARLDRVARVIEGTALITADSANGAQGRRRYTPQALRQIAAMAEGLPAYANHVAKEQAFKPRDVRDLIGRHTNVRYEPSGARVVSDLRVLEHQAPWIFALADEMGDVVGNSLVSRGIVHIEGDTEVVDEILVLRSADLVTDPASTKGLFEHREEWQPTSAADEGRPGVHERLAAALEGRPLPEALPAGVRQRMAAAFGLIESHDPLPADAHRRLAAALTGKILDESHRALPEGVHERLLKALL